MIIHDSCELHKLLPGKPLLLMLPFAGGNTYSYKEILLCFKQDFDVVCPELPGRGRLSDMPLVRDVRGLTEYVLVNWMKCIDLNRPYILFGHSMGGLMVYLLLTRLVEEGLPLPLHMVTSGRGGPSFKREREPTHGLPSVEFRNKLREQGGIPEYVLADDDLMDYFEPILRSDFEAVETYTHVEFPSLDVPISVLYGSEEQLTFEAVSLWRKESSKLVRLKKMTGNHFFIFKHIQEIASYLSQLMNLAACTRDG